MKKDSREIARRRYKSSSILLLSRAQQTGLTSFPSHITCALVHSLTVVGPRCAAPCYAMGGCNVHKCHTETIVNVVISSTTNTLNVAYVSTTTSADRPPTVQERERQPQNHRHDRLASSTLHTDTDNTSPTARTFLYVSNSFLLTIFISNGME